MSLTNTARDFRRVVRPSWVLWGDDRAIYEMTHKGPSRRASEIAEQVRHWFFFQQKPIPILPKKIIGN